MHSPLHSPMQAEVPWPILAERRLACLRITCNQVKFPPGRLWAWFLWLFSPFGRGRPSMHQQNSTATDRTSCSNLTTAGASASSSWAGRFRAAEGLQLAREAFQLLFELLDSRSKGQNGRGSSCLHSQTWAFPALVKSQPEDLRTHRTQSHHKGLSTLPFGSSIQKDVQWRKTPCRRGTAVEGWKENYKSQTTWHKAYKETQKKLVLRYIL